MTLGLLRVRRSFRISAKQVFACRHRLEMRRVHAAANAAQVIELQTDRYLPDESQIREAVGEMMRLPSLWPRCELSVSTTAG